MMLLLFPMPAFAVDFPWECPTFAQAADAAPYRDTSGGLDAHYRSLRAAALAYFDESCAWVETTTDRGDSIMVERVCEGGGARVTVKDTSSSYSDHIEVLEGDTSRLTVEVASGETWTRIEVASLERSSSWGSSGSGGGDGYEASWDGAFTGLPDDGWFSAWEGSGSSGSTMDASRSVETPDCSLTWYWTDDGEQGREYVTTGDGIVSVAWYYDFRCSGFYVHASVNHGESVGSVDLTTWERVGDLDADGYEAGSCDCADDDATVNISGEDIPDDGVDQNCSGSDRSATDDDDDGYHTVASGGDDCDDTSSRIHPGGRDYVGDGVDGDCDGADDVDADGDMYTADGDLRLADCDETDARIHPGAHEVPCDGVDQDCDGVDACDEDTGSADTGSADTGSADTGSEDTGAEDSGADTADSATARDTGPDDTSEGEREAFTAEPEDEGGCAGGVVFLAFLPLLGARRRARSP